MKTFSTKKSFQVLHNLTDIIKSTINRRLEATPYLSYRDQYGLDLLSEFQFYINNITLYTDFDSYDKNLTLYYNIDKKYSSLYVGAKAVETGCEALDIAFAHEYAKMNLMSLVDTPGQ